jgi:hypothetical protein
MSTNYVQKATGASPTGLTDSLLFDDGSEVGIGTTSPDGLLTITTASQSQLLFHASSGDGGIMRFDGGDALRLEVLGSDSEINLGDYTTERQTDPRINFYSGGTDTFGNFDNRLVSVGATYAGVGEGIMRFLSRIVEIRTSDLELERRSFRLRIDDGGGQGADFSAMISLYTPATCIEFAVDNSLVEPGDAVRVRIGASPDTRLDINDGALLFTEMGSAPSGITNRCIVYAEDNGSGKTRLMARFQSGSAQQIAIEP